MYDSDENARRNGRRARSMCRRYAKSNELVVLVTLTFDAAKCGRPTQREEAMTYGARFIRALRAAGHLHGAYVIVPELHKDGEHYHVHVALPLREVNRGQVSYPKWVLQHAHPFGFVDVRLFKNRRRQKGSGVRECAGYVAKYVGKSYDDRHDGRHRYEVAQGFQPASVRIEAPTLGEWSHEAIGAMHGEVPSFTWRSDAEWRGPPAVRLEW